LTPLPSASFESFSLDWIERAALALEIFAVSLIVVLLFAASIRFGLAYLQGNRTRAQYETYRRRIGQGLLLGLEILVAADIVRTVTLEPSLTNVAVLGILVLVRTFLSWSLVVELEGRWPWQARTTDEGLPPEAD
jgi:uncharacterized membrane protein